MKKKLLIPVLGVFVFAIVFSLSTRASTNDETTSLFVESDNIAYAEGGSCSCVPSTNSYCIYGSSYLANYKLVCY